MTNKRIWLLADDFPSDGRPNFVFVEQLVMALVDMGIQVSVIAEQSITHNIVRKTNFLPRYIQGKTNKGNKFDIYRPYSISLGNHFRLLSCFFSFIKRYQVSRIFKTSFKKGDILYGHFWHSAFFLLPFAIKYKAPLFVACGEGDDAMEMLVHGLTNQQLSLLKNNVTGVISVSSENKRKSIVLGLTEEDKIIVLPNCVDEAVVYPKENVELKKKLGIQHDDFVISYTGAFITRKGSKVLSEAIKSLKDSKIKALFIGSALPGDDCTPDCDGIAFIGRINHAEIADYLACANIFVLPTLNEGCSNAIVEALACGVPVISSNKPFNHDILNCNNSILVNPESVEEVAAAIKRLIIDKDCYMKLRSYTMAHSSQYSIAERARKISEFINKQTDKS